MKKVAQLKKQLEGILLSGELAQLDQFRDKKTWTGMTPDERELLGTLFVIQGEKELKEGNRHVLESFKLASKVAPKSSHILYRQAMAYASQDTNMYCLTSASRLFERLVGMDPEFFDAWHNWGTVYIKLGLFANEPEYFEEGDRIFAKAEALAAKHSSAKVGQLYRHWGVNLYYLGKLSGEANDFHNAISKYQKAIQNGLDTVELWNDHGNALVELSVLLNSQDILLEAIEYYWKTIHQSPDCLEGWINLAFSFQKLFLSTYIETYFNLAVESYEHATKLDANNSSLWMRWGQLLCVRGKNKRDEIMIKDSLDKHETADLCEPDNAAITNAWAEAILAYGALQEDLNLLRLAETKVLKSLEMQGDNSDTWGLYAYCQLEYGNYFCDHKYFTKAIEKFQHAISLNREDPVLWHGIMMANCLLGDATSDKRAYKQATKHCMRVVDCGGHHNPFFWNDWGVILMKLGTMTHEKRYIEAALAKFEQAIRLKKQDSNSDNIEVEWLYNYGCALDFLGDYQEPSVNYEKAAQVLTRVLEINPNYHSAHFNLAMALAHLGELNDDAESFYRSFEHFATYSSYEGEDETVWCEWGVALLNFALLILDPLHPEEGISIFELAESKLIHALALGQLNASYHLACLYSLNGNYNASMNYLERASRTGVLTSLDELLHDDWLEGVRQTQLFHAFYNELKGSSE